MWIDDPMRTMTKTNYRELIYMIILILEKKKGQNFRVRKTFLKVKQSS